MTNLFLFIGPVRRSLCESQLNHSVTSLAQISLKPLLFRNVVLGSAKI